ncbi:MAG: metallophosphoesterase [Alphaproteobacteria bacterium]|nr:metallophosphoesterase [Alphaproteobacteria bacterium]
MRTLVLSDIHIGPEPGEGADYNIFAGAESLPAMLDAFVSPPTRVFINGDGVDFLMNEDPLALDPARAVSQARLIATSANGRPTFEALGRVLAGGGEVIFRLGNHDIELALGEVQAVFREAMAQPAEVAAKLQFLRGEQPTIMEVGGARLLLTHGEHNDEWNYISWDKLPGPGGPEVAPDGFDYPPGSMLVKTLLNPLKRKYGLRFADLLKPDVRGAVLTGLAVNPDAISVIWQRSTAELMRVLNQRESGPVTFLEGDEPGLLDVDSLGLELLVMEAGLTEEEREALDAKLSPHDGPLFFGGDDEEASPGLWASIRSKLARSGMQRYARMHRCLAAEQGQSYFSLEPTEDEWKDAKRLSQKFDADAVIIGHTHSARWRREPVEGRELTFLNTGTWIWMLRLPPPSEDTDNEYGAKLADMEWEDYLRELRENPSLDPAKAKLAKLETRFTGALITEHPQGGATLQLVEWTPEGTLAVLESGRVQRGA